MTTKPRPGSMLAADNKAKTVFLIVAAIVTLILGLCIFVIDTDLKLFSRRAGIIPNVLGAAALLGSWYVLYWGAKNEATGKAGLGWFLLLLAGLLVSCGFNFDYFGLK